jgi:hypothetical protein
VAFEVSVGRAENFLRSFALVGLDSGGRDSKTRDLRVMRRLTGVKWTPIYKAFVILDQVV